MGFLSKAQGLWSLAVCGWLGVFLVMSMPAQAARTAQLPDVSGDASRMVFKANRKNKKEPSCQLTLMHVYTSKFNKKFTQFAFTGSVVAKREVGKPMVLSVIGQTISLPLAAKASNRFQFPA